MTFLDMLQQRKNAHISREIKLESAETCSDSTEFAFTERIKRRLTLGALRPFVREQSLLLVCLIIHKILYTCSVHILRSSHVVRSVTSF